jgi:glutamine amidotransferase
MTRITVIDLGTGNLRSVARALETVAEGSCDVRVSDTAEDVAGADKIVFPGQSAIGSCMDKLRSDNHLFEAVVEATRTRPFLGICIGLQALYGHSSEDGGVECLHILDGEVRHFLEAPGGPEAFAAAADGTKLKIPHMGWNNVHRTVDHPLWRGIEQDAWFYFVHSYCAFPAVDGEAYGTARHGLDFAAAAGKRNLFAVQFHPEKSQRNGLELLKNFIQWDGTL